MIKYIKKTYLNYDANSYIVYDDQTKNCLIIDLCGDFSKILDITNSKELNIVGAILTHGHYDHIVGANDCIKSGIRLYACEDERELLKDSRANVAKLFGIANYTVEPTDFLSEGVYNFGGITVEIIKTPGHTKGCICIKIGDLLFTGDTLFEGTFGRCDLPTGDIKTLKKSINEKLFTLTGVTVLPGHGEDTTIEKERKSNPINGY